MRYYRGKKCFLKFIAVFMKKSMKEEKKYTQAKKKNPLKIIRKTIMSTNLKKHIKIRDCQTCQFLRN